MSDAEKPNEGEIILYQTQEGTIRVEVLYESETFWLNQKRIAELFGVELPTISYHLKEIYDSGELSQEATLRKIRRVQKERNREVSREIEFYNLDAIISVGYRVNSTQATQFRIWATQTLREFVIKGFVLDDERLKMNRRFGKNFTGTEEEQKSNVIYKESDKLSGRQPIEFVQATRPIVIIDEPQSVDATEKAQEAIRALNPLCTLREKALRGSRRALCRGRIGR